ncbi:uracil-xanthine permease [Neobittarella massiliensis]|uniref:Uracil-xanthine permease n=1 Tax=Neobittarella massiliensis (ex Bilen et al. 2018) TaxID=2041842 RepID=A0A8J6LUL5_9FIRM|nr:uracil-xanthine permease family protein [Neobittarella massiliensis]MBC3515865.1 uracil-xanthine permease [Neobittarella massiliensis]
MGETANLTTSKKVVLGVQHLFAMFGATVLVPSLTGLNVSVALICAGLGTLLFHLVTSHKVPVFLGSSFAYIGALQIVIGGNSKNIPKAQSGIIAAGLIYILVALIVKYVGVDVIRKTFPPVVTGPVIVVIGLTLAPTGISMAQVNWPVALFTLAVIIAVSVFTKGFFKLVPILIGLVSGYLLCVGLDLSGVLGAKLIDTSLITGAPWISPFWDFGGKFFTLPQFDLHAITLIAPVALVTFMEHIGDITTNGSVIGKDLLKDPGLHRTLLGDGLATSLAGLLGGPANTTYSENTGVLAVTKVYDTGVLKIAGCFAIFLGVFGKFGGVLASIPDPVKGGMSIMLFGMIAAVGLRTIAEAQLDFSHSRNLITVGLILVFGLGMSAGIQIGEFTVSGLFIAVVVGVLANKILPQNV